MRSYLEERMNKVYSGLKDKQQLESETYMVKTYTKEYVNGDKTQHKDIYEYLKSILLEGITNSGEFYETEEEYFFGYNTKYKNEHLSLFLDTSNKRYWKIHSINRSQTVDSFLERITRDQYAVDDLWMPKEMFDLFMTFGRLMGVGVSYERLILNESDEDFPNTLKSDNLSVQLSGSSAESDYKVFKDLNQFKNRLTISRAKIKTRTSNSDSTLPAFGSSIDDIKFNGKITARGTSFANHMNLVNKINRIYGAYVREIECNNTVEFEQGNEVKYLELKGKPIEILFCGTLDPELLCEDLFSGRGPFKLWGVPCRVASGKFIVNAIDLHSNTMIDFEVNPYYMTAYLKSGGCGNAVMRLITNLQHHYDANIKIAGLSFQLGEELS